MAVSFISEENRRKAMNCLRSLTNFIEYTPHKWDSISLVLIGTDCIGSYKPNYHTITTTTAPEKKFLMV